MAATQAGRKTCNLGPRLSIRALYSMCAGNVCPTIGLQLAAQSIECRLYPVNEWKSASGFRRPPPPEFLQQRPSGPPDVNRRNGDEFCLKRERTKRVLARGCHDHGLDSIAILQYTRGKTTSSNGNRRLLSATLRDLVFPTDLRRLMNTINTCDGRHETGPNAAGRAIKKNRLPRVSMHNKLTGI